MDDPSDANGSFGGWGRATVCGRRIAFEIASGRIVKGPKALVGKWICFEQMADILAGRDVLEHLYTAEDETELHLARIDYLLSQRQESEGRFSIGSHIKYGHHGVFRVVRREGSEVILQSKDRELSVPYDRLASEAKVLPYDAGRELTSTPKTSRQLEQEYLPETEAAGSIHIDDAEIDAIISRRLEVLIEQRIDQIVERVADRVANHLDEHGKDPSVTPA